MEEAGEKNYEVKLEVFEGPLELLLHLIRKNEVDIFDIPIAKITDQYLEYLDMMEALNIAIAGDFLVMASSLIHIKSKMLLPDTQEEEEEDPRVEITRPLLEYLRLKEIAGELSERALLNKDVFTRALPAELTVQLQEEGATLDVNLFQLIDAFKSMIEEKLPGSQLTFQVERWSVKEKTAYILDQLKNARIQYFEELFDKGGTLAEFIATFLALLELVQMGLVRVFQAHPEAEIRLEASLEEKDE
ncbi:MAG: segregation/condensation protein A [Deltaproteobacteria bacterium]|nr:segregation/condensation protein A [Deltaproteobacteria bacterium]MBW1920211.1 segregation/condensation protein A [Deltaproteobacteria bacterium]MBW1977092.1 segregation/condensation protein A [Deltaproteobacteria bacterium]MBW2044117.1 segregation/condensation protein A [Deltaproteobacteria bacterium]MBW2300879.1 segregation/condensation protein A [Deltaproteobacteria bacterium]